MYEKIYLDKENPEVFIDCYKCDGDNLPAILVIPGGGYGCVCADREGAPIAEAFMKKGFVPFVLGYRVAPNRYPAPLLDGARAIAYIRKNWDKFSVDATRIFTVGFSAGGHLVGLLATHHKYAEELLFLPENFTRPTGSIYCYPVVSALSATHGASFANLLGKPVLDLTDEEKERFSIDKCVNSETPPAFIWHTAKDELVPPLGSLKLAEAYMAAGVPVSMHLYPYGTHGVALANEITKCDNENWIQPLAQGWVDYATEFIKTIQ